APDATPTHCDALRACFGCPTARATSTVPVRRSASAIRDARPSGYDGRGISHLGRRRRSALLADPGEDRAGVGEDRAVGQLERGKLLVPRRLAQLLARALAQEGDGAAVGGD